MHGSGLCVCSIIMCCVGCASFSAVVASKGACDLWRLLILLACVPSLTAVCVSPSSPVRDSERTLTSTIEALSGVVAMLEAALGPGVGLVSALTRMRRAWSSMREVMIASVWTYKRV